MAGPRPDTLAFFLASNVALSLPSKNPLGGLRSSPKAHIEYSLFNPRAQIHLATSSAFPQIVSGHVDSPAMAAGIIEGTLQKGALHTQ